jgi:hypothetical protein
MFSIFYSIHNGSRLKKFIYGHIYGGIVLNQNSW